LNPSNSKLIKHFSEAWIVNKNSLLIKKEREEKTVLRTVTISLCQWRIPGD